MAEPGEQVVAEARRWIGTPFHWGAAVRGVGCDCKGLLAGVGRALGWPEADSFEAGWVGYGSNGDPVALTAGMARLFERVSGPWLPGDILLLRLGRKPQHLAIYTGIGSGAPRMIHACAKGPRQVIEVPMGSAWLGAVDSIWRKRELVSAPAAGDSDHG